MLKRTAAGTLLVPPHGAVTVPPSRIVYWAWDAPLGANLGVLVAASQTFFVRDLGRRPSVFGVAGELEETESLERVAFVLDGLAVNWIAGISVKHSRITPSQSTFIVSFGSVSFSFHFG